MGHKLLKRSKEKWLEINIPKDGHYVSVVELELIFSSSIFSQFKNVLKHIYITLIMEKSNVHNFLQKFRSLYQKLHNQY